MAYLNFDVTRYYISLTGHRQTSSNNHVYTPLGEIRIYGNDGESIWLTFVPDDDEVPPAFMSGDKRAIMFFPISQMGQWVDLLRNEKPLYGFIDTNNAEWAMIRTDSSEPIGEGES